MKPLSRLNFGPFPVCSMPPSRVRFCHLTAKSDAPPFTACKMIKFYCDRGLVAEARRLFDEIPDRNVVVWTAMISGYTSNSRLGLAWVTFQEMRREGVYPNAFTISNLLKVCKSIEHRACGSVVHGLAVKHGVEMWAYVENALLDMYAACGDSMEDACAIFEGMTERVAASWTTMIAGFTRRSGGYAGLWLFRRMVEDDIKLNSFNCSIAVSACASVLSLVHGKQIHAAVVVLGLDFDLAVGNALVDMYCRCMNFSDARCYFSLMPERDLITWNSIIAGFGRYHSYEAFHLFSVMARHCFKPDCFTMTSIIASCANVAVFHFGQQVHGSIIHRGFSENLVLCNGLIDMYAKCGCIIDSCQIFNNMNHKDLFSWTSMLVGFANHGYGRETIKLFNNMISSGFCPDKVACVAVLSACNHAGLVDEGLRYFSAVENNYGILLDPMIYGCIINLLGRKGWVKEAYELVERMPFQPDRSIWSALLAACKVHRNKDLGLIIAEKVLNLMPKGPETYVMLSNIFAADGKWSEFAETWRAMRGVGSKKEAGRSDIEVRNQVYSFVVGERTCLQLDLVYEELEKLVTHLRDFGYLPDLD